METSTINPPAGYTIDSSSQQAPTQQPDDNTIASMDPSALSDLIQQHEGFSQKGSRAQRNNNPGNLKVNGDLGKDDGGFAVFSDPKLGRAALENQVGSFQQRYPSWTPMNLAARWLGSPSGDPNAVNPHEGDVQAYGKAITPPTAAQTPANTTSSTAQPQQAQPTGLPDGYSIEQPQQESSGLPEGYTVEGASSPTPAAPEQKSTIGKVWDFANTPILDHFSSQPNATQNFIENLVSKGKFDTSAPTDNNGLPIKIGSSVAAGATSPLGLLLLAGGPLTESLEGLGTAGEVAAKGVQAVRAAGQAGIAYEGGKAVVKGLQDKDYTEAGLGALQASLGAYGSYGDISDLTQSGSVIDRAVIQAANPSLSQADRIAGSSTIEKAMQNVRPFIQNAVDEAGGDAPKSLADLGKIIDAAKADAWSQYEKALEPFKDTPVDTTPVATDIQKAITPYMEQRYPEVADQIRQQAGQYSGSEAVPATTRPQTYTEFLKGRPFDPVKNAADWADEANRAPVPVPAQDAVPATKTLGELSEIKKGLGGETSAYQKKSMMAKGDVMNDPSNPMAGKIAELNSVRNLLYNNLDSLTGSNAGQLQRAYGTLKSLGDAIDKGQDKLDLNQAKGLGSAFSSFIKRELVRTAGGAAIGQVLGHNPERGAAWGALSGTVPYLLHGGLGETAESRIASGLKKIKTNPPVVNQLPSNVLKGALSSTTRNWR
jgi:hypothetical protein